ncbi:hypothetical protein G3341_12580 [Providencia vermicola]|uniref:hypothetical protein n=1 Tax=Providencia vermicola TaxID=333965 RepID=UPI0013A73452|nr:hypothetical protein [Providencia vermicola]QIC16467.1 hypothetical protein G3341_12580 [Providencia vermicola]
MSIFASETKNQHFVSQVEQRENSCNKNASNKNQEIFKYTRVDESQFDDGKRVKISTNQSDFDLFTLAKKDSQRKNLENLMGNLESNYLTIVDKIEKSCENHKNGVNIFFTEIDDIKKVLELKFLTRFRNPYLIKETLRLISFTKNFILDDDRHLEALIALHKAENNIDFLSKKYGVTKDEYISWLNTLVGLLLPIKGGSLLSGMVNEFFEASEFGKKVFIYYYDNEGVLLPDCGTLDIAESDMITYGFNLTSKIFILLAMPVCKDIASFKVKQRSDAEMNQLINDLKIKYPNITNEAIQRYLEFEKQFNAKTSITYAGNNTQMLDVFNFGVKRLSKQYYFSSSSS